MWLRFVCLIVLFPQWAVAGEFRLSYGIESFLWQELDLDPAGHSLKESGFRHVLALEAQNQHTSQWLSDIYAHMVFGDVDYDGWSSDTDINGNLFNKVNIDTEYLGYGVDVGFSYFPSGVKGGEAAGAGVRLALGLDKWDRDLQGPGGYREEYFVSYGRVAGVYASPSSWRTELGIKKPISTTETIDLSAYGFVGDVKLSPKGQASLYANVSYRINEQFGLKLAYDGYLFDQSDDEIVYNLDGYYYAIHQPESRMQTISLNVSMAL